MVSPELLRKCPLFAKQNHYMLDEIAMISDDVDVKAGDWIFSEKENADYFFLVLDGKIELTMYLFFQGSGEHLQTTSPLGKNEIFGWSAVVPPHVYTLGARAVTDSKVLSIEAGSLRDLLDDNPEYGYFFMKKISEVISERLIFKCIQLLSLVLDEKKSNVIETTT